MCNAPFKTGTMRAVRRHLFPQHSAPGRGIVWEWLSDDGSWTAYEASVCDYLEQQVARGAQLVDLAALGYNYTVNCATHTQTNKTSSFCRSVRRQAGPPYPATTVIAPPGHTGVACSCHQCLGGGAAGPMSGRYRHSMTNLPAYAVPQPPHRTAVVLGAHQAFSPYNKPSLSGARSAPKLSTANLWAGALPSLGNQPLYRSSLSHVGPQHQPPGLSAAGAARYLVFRGRSFCPPACLVSGLGFLLFFSWEDSPQMPAGSAPASSAVPAASSPLHVPQRCTCHVVLRCHAVHSLVSRGAYLTSGT